MAGVVTGRAVIGAACSLISVCIAGCGLLDFSSPGLAEAGSGTNAVSGSGGTTASAGAGGTLGPVSDGGSAGGNAQGGNAQGGTAQGGNRNAGGGAGRGMGGSAGFPGSAGEACTGPLPFPSPTTGVLDDFNRTTGLGENWVGDDASMYVVEGMALKAASATTSSVFWHVKQGATQEVYATFSNFDDNMYNMMLFLKSFYPNTQGFSIALVYGNLFNGAPALSISYNYGDWQDLVADHSTVYPGDVIGGRSFPNGCVELFVNGELRLHGDLSTVVPQETRLYDGSGQTYVGVGQDFDRNTVTQACVWDDFGVSSY